MCRFEPSYLAVTICEDSESSAKGHRVRYDKKRLESAYCNRGQKCKARVAGAVSERRAGDGSRGYLTIEIRGRDDANLSRCSF